MIAENTMMTMKKNIIGALVYTASYFDTRK